ncbi:MAG: lysostaphin resistance A-like protein [Chitinophagia bacterium]|jgi:membrane protease YdiL (CAAX protease family)
MEQELRNQSGITDKAGLFILIGMMGAGAMVGSLLSAMVWKGMTGQTIEQMQVSMNDPVFANAVRVVQTILSACMFLLPPIITARMIQRNPFDYLLWKGKISLKTSLSTIVVMVTTLIVASQLSVIMEWIPLSDNLRLYFREMEDKYMQQIEVMSQMKGIPDLLLSLLVMAAFPAIVEEAFFRGGFQNMMYRSTKNIWVSVIITSLLFSAIHFSFYGFLSRVALSLVLGLLYAYSKNLWVPILAHFVNNAIAVGQVYYLRSTGQSVVENIDEKYPWYLVLGMVVFFYFSFQRFRKSMEDGVE